MRQFEHTVTHELPILVDECDLDESARVALSDHAEGLKDWMAGILEWHRRCARYTEAELRRHHSPVTEPAQAPLPVRQRLSDPSGLGTSAARLATGATT